MNSEIRPGFVTCVIQDVNIVLGLHEAGRSGSVYAMLSYNLVKELMTVLDAVVAEWAKQHKAVSEI